jgi:hypothetical protein
LNQSARVREWALRAVLWLLLSAMLLLLRRLMLGVLMLRLGVRQLCEPLTAAVTQFATPLLLLLMLLLPIVGEVAAVQCS